MKKHTSDNTLILQIGHNTYADDWKFDPLALCVLFSAPTWTIPFYIAPGVENTSILVRQVTEWEQEHTIKLTVAEDHWYCRRLILNYFLGCSHSPSYRYPCSAERMMQKLGKYSIDVWLENNQIHPTDFSTISSHWGTNGCFWFLCGNSKSGKLTLLPTLLSPWAVCM